MTEPTYRNSAGRFLNLLRSMNKSGKYLDIIPGAFCSQDEATTNGKEAKNQLCLIGLSKLDEVYQTFIKDMQKSEIGEEQRSVLLKGLENLKTIIYPMQLNSGMRAASEAEFSLLEVCATILPQEGEIQQNDIEDIKQSINDLREVIEKSETPDVLKKLLMEYIRLSHDSISRYSIYGVKGLKDAIKSMLAESAEMQWSLNEEEKEKVRSSEAWQAAVKHLRLLDQIGSKILEYQPMLQAGTQLLLGT